MYCKIKVKGWHEITDIMAMLMREPSVTSQLHYPNDIRTIFMQICIFSRGACFGLGERYILIRVFLFCLIHCVVINI